MKRLPLRPSIPTLLTITLTSALSHSTGFMDAGARLSRKGLIKLGGLALTALTTGAWKSRSSAPVAAGASLSPALQCVLTPEQTEGPFYIPREKIRRDLREGKPGAPLQLRLAVVDAASCKPIKGAAVDIWHCDAGGVYAGFESASAGGPPGGNAGPTDKRTFLRGIQRTNARGLAQFQTIYPGWYRGRTVHIHVKVHLGGVVVGHVTHTGQLYFQDSLTSSVYQSGVYKSRAAARDTFNATDSIFASGGRQSMLAVTHDGHGGFIGAITLGVKRS